MGREPLKSALPAFAWVGLTSRCNLNCSHCQRMRLIKQGVLKPRDISEAVFDKLETELFPHLKRIQFGGNNFGEPLLTSNWDSFFARVSKLGIRISLVTNGRLLTPDRIKAMVDAGVEFNFSLEGATDQRYERVRGYKFKEFTDIVGEVCRQKAEKTDSSVRVNLGFTSRHDNIREMRQLIPLAARLGVDRITVTHFVPWAESQRQQSLVYHKELSNEILDIAKREADELGLVIDLPQPFELDEVEMQSARGQDRQLEALLPCRLPWTSVSINEQGDVMPCCASSVIMGNLNRASFSDIWNTGKYEKLRRTVNTGQPPGFCRNCGLRGINVGSDEALSFSSDERILLGGIGVDADSGSVSGLRRIRQNLLKSRWGQKLNPFLTKLYRRYIAFYT